MDELIRQLENIYGKGEGFKRYTTIMPGILADFNKLLKKAPVGKEITEDYHLEDGKGVIHVHGSKSANGQIAIDAKL